MFLASINKHQNVSEFLAEVIKCTLKFMLKLKQIWETYKTQEFNHVKGQLTIKLFEILLSNIHCFSRTAVLTCFPCRRSSSTECNPLDLSILGSFISENVSCRFWNDFACSFIFFWFYLKEF